jgi:hypothetical protein
MADLIEQISWFIQEAGPDDCWPWQGAVSGHGFPRIRHEGRQLAVRRIIMKTPEGMQTYQTCGNKRCCNPAHLTVGKPPGRPRVYPKWYVFDCNHCGKKSRMEHYRYRHEKKGRRTDLYCGKSCAALAAWERKKKSA